MMHGTYVAYVVHGCHCDECRRANREYEAARVRRKAQGRALFVPADPVRKRVQRLVALGMSHDEIARSAGLNDARLSDLMTGHWRTKRPLTRMKRENAERIMAVRRRAPAPGTRIHTPDAPSLVLDLMALGYTPPWICKQLGLSYQGRKALLSTNHLTRTYARLVRLHGRTITRAPESPQAGRARNFATAYRARFGRRRAA